MPLSSSERVPLRPHVSPVMYGVPRDRDYRQIFHDAPDDDDAASITIPRRAAVVAIIYAATTTVALLACLLALLLRGGGGATDARRRGDGVLPPLSTEPTSPRVSRGPHHAAAAPARSAQSPFSPSAFRFLVLTDLHLEPHYNASSPNADLHVCRDDEHITECIETDWELQSASASASCVSSSSTSAASSAFSLGRYLCDPPYAFLSTALTSLAASLSASSLSLSLSFLLVPGDLVAHFSPCPLTHYATFDAALGLLASAFPSTPIIFAIGNADLYPNAYLPPSPSSHHVAFNLSSCPAPFSSLLSSLLRHGVIDADDDTTIATFCQGGYYARVLPKQRLRVVVLNTQLWAADYVDTVTPTSHPSASFSNRSQQWRDNTTRQPLRLTPSLLSFSFTPSSYPSNSRQLPPLPCEHRRRLPDPYHQFRFLRQQISLASLSSPAQRIVLMGHRPPGAKAGSAGWCAQYEDELRSIISEWPNVVSALMFGDYSEDRVKLMDAQPAAAEDADEDEQTVSSSSSEQQLKVLHINPGLTMRKNVNPAARLYEVDPRSGSIVNYHQYYVDLQQQQLSAGSRSGSVHWLYQYDAVLHYGMQAYGSEGWLAVARRMMAGERGLLHRYIAAVNVWKAGDGDGIGYICDMLALGLEENTDCRRTGTVRRLERGRDSRDSRLLPMRDHQAAAPEGAD